MSVIHAAIRRPIPDVRMSAVAAGRGDSAAARSNKRGLGATHGNSFRDSSGRANAFSGGGGDDLGDARGADFDRLVEHAIAAIRAAGDRPDPVFGPFAELNSVVRAVTYHEGWLLEQGMVRLASENPSLLIMPSETALPIVPAALEMLERNDWRSLNGIRLRSEVHYKSCYVPDLFIVDPGQHRALIVDMKRSLASYPERRLDPLRKRMMAAALIAADWLHIEGKVAGVTSVEVAIVDGSGERRDRGRGIFALDEIGELIEVADAGEAMLELRAKFARRVQEEICAACLRAIGDAVPGEDGVGHDASVGPANDVDNSSEPEPDINPLRMEDQAEDTEAIGVIQAEPAVVGFARGRTR